MEKKLDNILIFDVEAKTALEVLVEVERFKNKDQNGTIIEAIKRFISKKSQEKIDKNLNSDAKTLLQV